MLRVRGARVVVVVAIAFVGATACSSSDPGESSGGPAGTASSQDPLVEVLAEPQRSLVAEAAVDEVEVFDSPSATVPTRRIPRFDPAYVPTEGSPVPQVFLVTDVEATRVKVLLPVRPNGATGWINRSAVRFSDHSYRIVVELGAHRITTYEGAEVLQAGDIAVGTQDTPTPGGTYYINILLQPPDPDGPYGRWAYGLSGYSETLNNFAGGTGVIGIHGTDDESVIGTDVSHGCIRMRNADIDALATVLPLGTPVEIRA